MGRDNNSCAGIGTEIVSLSLSCNWLCYSLDGPRETYYELCLITQEEQIAAS